MALASLLAPINVRALGSLSGLELVARGTDGWGWITVAAAVGITLVAGAYPVWRMNRSDAVEAIRTGA